MLLSPRTRWTTVLALLVAACAATAAAAQPALAPAISNPDSALARTLQSIAGQPLALGEAIDLALVRSTDLQQAQAQVLAARGAVRREGGAFAPRLYGQGTTGSDHQPTASFFSGADVLVTETAAAEAGAQMTLPLGTQITASVNTARIKTNSAFATLSPEYDTVGQLTITQPLLQGFGAGSRSERDAAVASFQQTQSLYDDARLATIEAVETAYWGLYAAERDYAVQLLIRDQAQAVLDQARIKANTGLVGPSDVATARVYLAQQSQAVMDSEEQLDRISDLLSTVIGRRPTRDARYHPRGQPPAEFPTIDQDRLVELAMDRSPQVAAAERAVAAARARAAGGRQNALPQLDLLGSLGGRGLAGTGREVVLDFGSGTPDTLFNALDTGLGKSLSQVLGRDYPTWNVGLRFSVPLGGRDRGERDRLDALVTYAEAQLEATRRDLDDTVREQQRELERGGERLRLAQDGVEASLDQVRIGMLQFQNGRTTAFELVRLSADLADAQRRYSAALFRTAQAAATLRRLTAGAYPDPGPGGSANEETAP